MCDMNAVDTHVRTLLVAGDKDGGSMSGGSEPAIHAITALSPFSQTTLFIACLAVFALLGLLLWRYRTSLSARP